MRVTRSTIFCLILVLTVLSAPVFAAKPQKAMSQNQAVAIARGKAPGRVLSATTGEKGGRRVHSVRILSDDGRVRHLRIDAVTGEVLRRPPGRR